MFATLFLGGVLAVFLTLSAVRGDAERGLLQPLVVRPVGRRTYLAARFSAAALVCALYVAVVYAGAVVVTGTVGGWWPDDVVAPGLGLVGGVVVLVALSLLGSTLLSATANGIATFMLFGGGMTAGLLGQIGEAVGSDTLRTIANVASWLLPFEALYQAGLHSLTAGTSGLTGVIVKLGPFGGAEAAGPWIVPWSVAYILLVGLAANRVFARQDL
jgi:ABC-type transport system involved in multi-copper enzyme maturation permease subunit